MPPSRRPIAPRGWEIEHRPVLVPSGDRPYATHQVFPGAFSASECRALVEMGTAAIATDATVQHGADDHTDGSLRQARVSWIAPDDDNEWVYLRMAGLAEQANEAYGFDLTGFTEDLQFTTYDAVGSFYTWHQDGLDGPVAGRKLSLVVQLSDPATYDGSDLQLLEVVEDYTDGEGEAWQAKVRRRGTVIAFPAFEYHRVTPLRSGVRHSLVCWIGGPPFR